MTASRCVTLSAAVLVTLAMTVPEPADAQQRSPDGEWWAWAVAEALAGEEIRTTRGRRVRIDGDRLRRNRGRRPGHTRDRGAPAFCRTGDGHPVFGRRWCLEKGFGLDRVSWTRGGLGDIIFRRVPRRDGAILERPGLADVLGEVVLGRLLARSGLDRDGTPLTARWRTLQESGARVLQIRAGSRPLAELTDLDGDGAVDVQLRSAAPGR